jgi:hypothetical protein
MRPCDAAIWVNIIVEEMLWCAERLKEQSAQKNCSAQYRLDVCDVVAYVIMRQAFTTDAALTMSLCTASGLF